MPARNALKLYSENGYYHIYNRGVNKAPVFLDHQDYLVFMSFLKDYLTPPRPITEEELLTMSTPYIRKNYYREISLLAFVLMPNHFHLELRQKQGHSIELFMRSLLTRYVKYFNRRHERVGHLFQAVYKGTLVNRDEYLLWVSRYIHRNSLEMLTKGQGLIDYPYSSYPCYLGKQNLSWVESREILSQVKNYQNFVENNSQDNEEPQVLAELTLEQDSLH